MDGAAGPGVEGPAALFPKHNPEETSSWTAEQTREVASIPVRFARIRPESRPLSKGLVFTYRITAEPRSADAVGRVWWRMLL